MFIMTGTMKKKVLIGVAWPYVNGDLHVGHLAGYLLPADIAARYHRLIGNDVLMVSGSDCFGTPITLEADKKGVGPAEIVAEYHAKDVELFGDILNLSYDLYTLTNHENHIKVTQDFFIKMMEEGYIFIDTQKQYYSTSENKFLPDRYVVGTCPYCGFNDCRSDQCDTCGKLLGHGELKNPVSNISKEKVGIKDTQHYFVDWPKMQGVIKSYVDSVSRTWRGWVAQETQGWLKEGLKARAITRDLDWGVPIPADRIPAEKLLENHENKRIYVWFDAVIGYFSASVLWASQNNRDWKEFWYGDNLKHYYFMGKDNLVFHTIFWPGQLMSYDKKLHLPDVPVINMFLNYEGKQFSKSRGWTLPIKDMVEKYGNDAIRFYLTLIMPENRDASFSYADFKEKNNGILVANLGNFIHRVLSLAKKNDVVFADTAVSKNTRELIEDAYEKSKVFLDKFEFRNYLNEILEVAAYGNSFVDKYKLWDLVKSDEIAFGKLVRELCVVILCLRDLITPVMPHASEKLSECLGLEPVADWPKHGKEVGSLIFAVDLINLVDDLKPLFRKIEE